MKAELDGGMPAWKTQVVAALSLLVRWAGCSGMVETCLGKELD